MSCSRSSTGITWTICAREWIEADIDQGWASCAITQNGFIRIVSQPRYPSPISPSEAMFRMTLATGNPRHEFWHCAVSLLDEQLIDRSRIHGSRQVTDAYLLALATHHDGRLVTFDQSVSLSAVGSATADNLEIL